MDVLNLIEYGKIMYAFLFSIGIFLYFSVVGNAVIAVASPRIGIIQKILVSPTIGISVLVLLVFVINRAGIPVKDFGAVFAFLLLAISVTIICAMRPVVPVRRILPYLLLLLLGLCLAARPMFSYGFNWISFANDDMANYSLGAQRFYENGFFAKPDIEALFQGKDYSQAYWFMHVLNNTRSGSELLLATIWATSGINPHQAFMPVVFALHGSLIFAAAALASSSSVPKAAPLITAFLVAISPMTTLGALYQLIAQVGGLAMLSVSVVLLFQTSSANTSRLVKIRMSAPVVLVCSGLFVYYPEVIPFLVAASLFYMAWIYFKLGNREVKKVLFATSLVALLSILILNTYFYDALLFLQSQASGGVKQSSTTEILFPYFLIPSGLAVSWGLIPIAHNLQEPWSSVSILAAIFIYLGLLFSLIDQLRARPSPVVSVVVIMLGVAVLLFFRNNDFGLFKLVMFMQPYVLAVLAIGLSRVTKYKLFAFIFFSIFVVFNFIVQFGYVQKSTGEYLGSLGELSHASKNGVIEKFIEKQNVVHVNTGGVAISDTSHIVLAKMQVLYTRGQSMIFPSRQFFVDFIEGESAKILSPNFDNVPTVVQYKQQKEKFVKKVYISTQMGANGFLQMIPFGVQKDGWDATAGSFDVFNRYTHNLNVGLDFEIQYLTTPRLNFVHSDLGQHYYLGRAGNISSYALENDPMFAGRQFSGFGRHFVFEVQSNELMPRVVLELSATLTKQFESLLPSAKLQEVPFGFLGRGSGRVFSMPMYPSEINGKRYFAIDIGRNAAPMEEFKSGLMLAYGRGIRLDRRLLTTFGRDISLIAAADFENLKPPAAISRFPSDLANKNLEYSGIYEDGWISERSFFGLLSTSVTKSLTIKGSIPQIANPKFSSTMVVKVDGNEIISKKIDLGDFDINVPFGGLPGRHRVEITFSDCQQLPGADGRLTAGYLRFLGFN